MFDDATHAICDPQHPPITREEAEVYLAADLMTALKATLRYCPVLATEPAAQTAATVDFTFTLGAGRLQTSTLRRRINLRDWEGRWVNCAGGFSAEARYFRSWWLGAPPKFFSCLRCAEFLLVRCRTASACMRSLSWPVHLWLLAAGLHDCPSYKGACVPDRSLAAARHAAASITFALTRPPGGAQESQVAKLAQFTESVTNRRLYACFRPRLCESSRSR